MAKRGEIPPDKNRERSYKHAATVDQVGAVQERVEKLGIGWHDAVAEAGVSRNVGYTLQRGQGSIGSLRTIEEWVSKKEAERTASRPRDPKEEWTSLADELANLGDEALDVTIEAVREYISAEKRRRAALTKILRVTPDHRR